MRLLLRRRRQERGAVAVEAALIFPLLILLTFGIIEVSLLLRDYVSLNSVVRLGARTVTALPKIDNFAEITVQDMQSAGVALPRDAYEELWIYQVDPANLESGLPIGASSFAPNQCRDNCIIYRWNDARDAFTQVTDSITAEDGETFQADWDADDHRACPFDADGDGRPDRDSVGIYLRATHTGVTGTFFGNVSISDNAVGLFEPITDFNADCEAG